MLKDFWNSPDLLIQTGSHMYGCATPESDFDRRGFVIEPAEYLLGRKKFEQYENKGDDTVIWGFSKFIHHLAKGTPNTFEILFAPANKILNITDAGNILLENKDIFIAKNQLMPFAGFARAEWTKARLMTKNKETGKEYFSPRVVGAKRKESYEKHGYSLKNAYHAVRLLSQGIELAKTGFISFPRPEATLLSEIRSGTIAFERVEAIIEKLDSEMMESIDRTKLPKYADSKKVDELYYNLTSDRVTKFFKERQNENFIS